MEAPTPASALIHSSTLVVAGIFLIIRFSVLFEFTLFTNYYLILLGALTLSFGAITAVFQNDIKKLGNNAFFIEDRNQFLSKVRSHLNENCVLLLMGARDPSLEYYSKQIWEDL